jgi:phosphopantetheinyl transferase
VKKYFYLDIFYKSNAICLSIMPEYLFRELPQGGMLALWHIQAEERFEADSLAASDHEELATLSHPLKQREFLCARMLAKTLLEKTGAHYQGLLKEANGKPFFKGSQAKLSLSHSFPFVAALLHTEYETGLDIEPCSEKIARVAPRFLSAEELEALGAHLPHLTTAWCIKEAVYKWLSQAGLSFREDLRVYQKEGNWYCLHRSTQKHYALHTLSWEHYQMAYIMG